MTYSFWQQKNRNVLWGTSMGTVPPGLSSGEAKEAEHGSCTESYKKKIIQNPGCRPPVKQAIYCLA